MGAKGKGRRASKIRQTYKTHARHVCSASQRTDYVRRRHAAAHEARDTSRNRVRLPSARASEHQHGPERVHDDLLLFGAEAAEDW